MSEEIIQFSNIILTLVTYIPQLFMYRLYMFCEIILITYIIFTLVTFITHPFMYSLYMFCEIIQITNITFTLVTYIPQNISQNYITNESLAGSLSCLSITYDTANLLDVTLKCHFFLPLKYRSRACLIILSALVIGGPFQSIISSL